MLLCGATLRLPQRTLMAVLVGMRKGHFGVAMQDPGLAKMRQLIVDLAGIPYRKVELRVYGTSCVVYTHVHCIK